MIADKAKTAVQQAILYELQNIVKNYGDVYHSEHEAYAVLLEEAQEVNAAFNFMGTRLEGVWSAVKHNQLKNETYVLEDVKKFAIETALEAVQCAAVCERFIETVKREDEHEKLS